MKLFELFSNPFYGYKKTISKIREKQNHYAKLSMENLKSDFVEIQNYISEQIKNNPSQKILTKELPKVFAIIIEILSRSAIVMTDSQIAGGIALHQKHIFESSKNNDSAYSIILAAILNSLTKQGVHIVLMNEALTKKYYEKFKSLLSFLEISADAICECKEDTEKRYEAYNSDILFGEIFQYCWDYIRKDNIDNTSNIKREFVIIDNADIILLDKGFITAQLNKSADNDSGKAAIITPYLFCKQYTKMAGISSTANNNINDYQNLYSMKVHNFDKDTKQIPEKNLVYKTRKEKYNDIVRYMKSATSENKFVIVDVRDNMMANLYCGEEQVSQYEIFKAVLESWNVEYIVATDNLNKIEKGKTVITDNLRNILITSNDDDMIFTADLVVLVLEKYPNNNINLYLQKHLNNAAIHFFLSSEDEVMSERLRSITEKWLQEGDVLEHPMLSKSINRNILQLQNLQSEYYKFKQNYNDILQRQYIILKEKRNELLSQYIYFPDNPEINVQMNKMREQCIPVVEKIKDKEYENILIPIFGGKKVMNITVNIQKFLDSDGYAVLDELYHQVFEHTIREHWEKQLMKFFNLHYGYERAIKQQQQFTDFVPLLDYDSLINSIYIEVGNRLLNSYIPMK